VKSSRVRVDQESEVEGDVRRRELRNANKGREGIRAVERMRVGNLRVRCERESIPFERRSEEE
jgi:hypothetical protein